MENIGIIHPKTEKLINTIKNRKEEQKYPWVEEIEKSAHFLNICTYQGNQIWFKSTHPDLVYKDFNVELEYLDGEEHGLYLASCGFFDTSAVRVTLPVDVGMGFEVNDAGNYVKLVEVSKLFYFVTELAASTRYLEPMPVEGVIYHSIYRARLELLDGEKRVKVTRIGYNYNVVVKGFGEFSLSFDDYKSYLNPTGELDNEIKRQCYHDFYIKLMTENQAFLALINLVKIGQLNSLN